MISGHHNKHFGGDAFSEKGFWGYPTATANFCEEDYAVTFYIAEFINAFTNFAYVYYALRSPRRSSWKGLDFMSIALIFVGIFSFVYHATLRLSAQYGDDISMYILAGSLLQPLYTHNQTTGVYWLVTISITLGITSFSLFYISSGVILYHLIAFSVMIHAVWPRTLYLIHFDKQRSKEEKARLMARFWKSVFVLIAAFVLWNIDLEKCFELRRLRTSIGLPWAWLIELHGWWHIMTAVGASEFIKLIRDVTKK